MMQIFRKNIVLFAVAMISAVGLCVLSYLAIYDYAEDNEEQYIRITNDGIIDELQTVVRYGIQLERYPKLKNEIDNAAGLLGEGSILVLENEDGQVMAASGEESHFSIPMNRYSEVRQELEHPDSGQAVGALVTYYPKDIVSRRIASAGQRSLAGSAVILLCLVAACMLLAGRMSYGANRLIPVIVAGIAVQGAFLVIHYHPLFEEAALRSAQGVSAYMSQTFDQLAESGVRAEDISDLEDYLQEKSDENPSIRQIRMVAAGEAEETGNVISADIDGMDRTLVIEIDESYIRSSVWDMVLVFVATIVLVVIVLRESLGLSEILEFRRSGDFGKAQPSSYAHVSKALRYGTFLSVTFDYICLAFSALVIREWNQGILGGSPAMAAALSISICSLASILGTMSMPWISRRMPARRLMILSALLMVGADLMAFLTTSTLVLVAMRFVAGAGSAGIKMIRYIEIAEGYSTEEERGINLTEANNGVIGGLLCGMGLGSVIAGVFGYQATFLAACIGNGLYLIFEYFCIPWPMMEGGHEEEDAEKERQGNLARRVLVLFLTRMMWKLMAVVVIPEYLLLMVIVCLIPGRIQALELPSVVLTYSNLVNGIAGLYIGEMLRRFLLKRMPVMQVQGLVFVLGAASLFVLEVPYFVTACILASAVLTGFVDGIGTPGATDLFMGNG
ncbi:MAG: MFS transporter, partial [Lachnospiraceae bacterium]|nr:MFS transporter [Lachnospiraceae bacterium]